MIAELRQGFSDHLNDCYRARLETKTELTRQSDTLTAIKTQLDAQDKDLAGIRTLKRMGAIIGSSIILIEAASTIAAHLMGR